MTNDRQQEIERNYEAFMQKLPQIAQTARVKFALMRDQDIVAFFDTAGDALTAGQKLYADRRFSIQQVEEAPVDLGFYSHAVS